MNETDIFEEIRAILREPQVSSVANPWNYTDADLIPQVRSAIRNLRARGYAAEAEMGADGVFVTEPSETEGMLLCYFVAERLLSGDLLQKLMDGELGVVFKAGADMIDTKTSAMSFSAAGDRFRDEFRTLLAIAMAGEDNGDSVLSSQTIQSDDGEVA